MGPTCPGHAGGDNEPHIYDNDRSVNGIHAQATAWRNNTRYETDLLAYSIDGNTEQLVYERMIHTVSTSMPRALNELHSTTRHSKHTPEHVSRIFNVGLGMAKDILVASTQKVVRQAVMPLNRRYRVDHIHLNIQYLSGNWTMDHLESKYISIRQHTGSMVFSDGNFVAVYPCKTKNDEDSTEALRRFTEDYGVPAKLKSDMAPNFVGHRTRFQALVQKLGINMTFSEPYRHNQLQQVDVAMRDLQRRWRTKMTSKRIPPRLWCFGIEHQAKLMQFIPRGHNERSGYEMLTGRTPDCWGTAPSKAVVFSSTP